MLRAKDCMKPVITIAPSATVSQAAERMKESKSGALVVHTGDRPAGIVTDRDIALRSTAQGFDPTAVLVDSVMSAELTGCFEDTSAEEAVSIMEERELHRVPVFSRQGKRLVGMLSIEDARRPG